MKKAYLEMMVSGREYTVERYMEEFKVSEIEAKDSLKLLSSVGNETNPTRNFAGIDRFSLKEAQGNMIDICRRLDFGLSKHIFRTYDIRGIAEPKKSKTKGAVKQDLTPKLVFYLGKTFATILARKKAKNNRIKISVSRDVRGSGQEIKDAFFRAVLDSGIDVVDVVTYATTPMLYFSIIYYGCDGGVSLTASHNPAEWNGMKQIVEIANIDTKQDIWPVLMSFDYINSEDKGQLTQIDELGFREAYKTMVKAHAVLGIRGWYECVKGKFGESLRQEVEKIRVEIITSQNNIFEGLKIVVDPGNGAAFFAGEIFKELGAEVMVLNAEPNENFPSHVPNPNEPRNMDQCAQAVLDFGAHLGFGYDTDGDRIGVVYFDGEGKRINLEGDDILLGICTLIKDLFAGKHDFYGFRPAIVSDLKCSRALREYIEKDLGNEFAVESETGYVNVKRRMKRVDVNAIFGGEQSGHMFPAWNWGFDDSILASVLFLLALKGVNYDFAALKAKTGFRKYPKTYDIRPPVALDDGAARLELCKLICDEAVQEIEKAGFKATEQLEPKDGTKIIISDNQGNYLGSILARTSG